MVLFCVLIYPFRFLFLSFFLTCFLWVHFVYQLNFTCLLVDDCGTVPFSVSTLLVASLLLISIFQFKRLTFSCIQNYVLFLLETLDPPPPQIVKSLSVYSLPHPRVKIMKIFTYVFSTSLRFIFYLLTF